ncbi:DUF1810 domain-containing protein [Leadbetterella sp. DM7]|uniref:DUF1810 domain-containing protein n=1 Tax=Leadbetterella sp. DM7 TaxID=3235085 RepID=UPI00349E79D3
MQPPLTRFLQAQESTYETALSEIRSGRKVSHWMWYIFPQIKGLGFSKTSRYYAIQGVEEAKAYLNDPVLGFRLREITEELLKLEENDAYKVFGSPDDLKLKSSMTLFAMADNTDRNNFKKVLGKFFNGEIDQRTVEQLKQ